MTENKEEFLTIAELAKRFRVSEMTVRRMIQRGDLKGIQLGRQWRIPSALVDGKIEAALEAAEAIAKADKAEDSIVE